MNNAQALAARMTEVEKIGVRAATADGLVSMYFDSYRAELSGGHLKGGTTEAGIAELQEVATNLRADYVVKSANPGFGNTWLF